MMMFLYHKSTAYDDYYTVSTATDSFVTYQYEPDEEEHTPPRNWRWFDVFRTHEPPKVVRLCDLVFGVYVRLTQDRSNATQRRREKRKAWLLAM